MVITQMFGKVLFGGPQDLGGVTTCMVLSRPTEWHTTPICPSCSLPLLFRAQARPLRRLERRPLRAGPRLRRRLPPAPLPLPAQGPAQAQLRPETVPPSGASVV